VYNLTHEIDVDKINLKINEYKEKNKDEIARNNVNFAKKLLKKDNIKMDKNVNLDTKNINETNNISETYNPNGQINLRSQPAPLEKKYIEIEDEALFLKKRQKGGGFDNNFVIIKSKQEAFSSVFSINEFN
jgi:hypothetical protein